MSDETEKWIREVAARLLKDAPSELSLDEIGEALGDRAVGPDEIERLMNHLERAGVRIAGEGGESLVEMLRQVIRTAHELRSAGERPSPRSISEKSGLSVRAVRVALLYAEVLKG